MGYNDIMAATNGMSESVGIRELSEIVNRLPATIRGWERDGVLPKHLRSSRDSQNRRCWTRAQVRGIKEWMAKSRRFPGSGLPGYHPTQEQIDAVISRMRADQAEAEAA